MDPTEVHVFDKTPETKQGCSSIILKILSLILLPASIAFGGWLIQSAIAEKNLEKDYVNISVSILLKPTKDVDDTLRGWAVDILNMHAPIPLPEKSVRSLKSGDGLIGKASIEISNGDLLELDGGILGKAVIEIIHSEGCRAEYKWSFENGAGERTYGSNLLFENYVTELDGNTVNKGQTKINAGDFQVEWSCGSPNSGWVYPRGFDTKIISNRSLDTYYSSQ